MIKKRLSHKGLLTLVTCVATLCILVLGMRVPDLSRPHRPKPKPRAYIEQQYKKTQPAQAKKCLEVEQPVLLTAVVEIPLPASCRTTYASSPPTGATRAVPPNNSRAPPA